LIIIIYSSYLYAEFSAAGQVYFDFGENSSDVNYLIYDNMAAGVRIKYPSSWNMLEQLGNISGNNILVDFYHTGINGTIGYSENANVIVSSLDMIEYVNDNSTTYTNGNNITQPSPLLSNTTNSSNTVQLATISSSSSPQPITPTSNGGPSSNAGEASSQDNDDKMERKQLNELNNSTITDLMETLSNFTLQESVPTIISGLPAHKITYTVAGNQSEVKQTQVWTFKDNKWFVVSYSAEPSAYFNPRTAQNILDSLLIR
jgi:hypothetical protein